MRRDAARLVDKDWPALLALSLLFVVMLVLTWQRWTHPIVDHGREMNVPLRILAGERLYIDILYYYGPLAPYFNALIFYLFGVHLNSLHAAGMVCGVFGLALIYWLARRLVSPWEAALTTALVLVTCALAGYLGNYVQPYAYAALYGWAAALASLACAVQFVSSRRPRWMCVAGVAIGLTAACKPELALLASAPVAVAWTLASLAERRYLWRPLWLSAGPAAAIAVSVYGPLLVTVPWQMLFTDTYEAFRQPQMMHFAHFMDGTLEWPSTGWAMLAGAGMFLAACSLTALLGLLLDATVDSWRRRPARLAWLGLVAGAGLWSLGASLPQSMDITPVRSAPIVLGASIALIIWRLWRHHARQEPLPLQHQTLLLIAVFSLIGIGRVIFNLSLWSPYTLFTAPTVIVTYGYLFFRVAPAVLLSSARSREYARVVGMVLVAIVLARLGIQHVQSARLNDFEINASRGRFLTDAAVGKTLEDAMRLVTERTRPGDYLLNLPQGTMINFLADRRNPLREEIIVPGFLTPEREAEAIRRVAAMDVRLILVANHLTPEYRDFAFGVHYNKAFMRWIEAHYRPIATFSSTPGRELNFGDFEFFIRAYERNAGNVD